MRGITQLKVIHNQDSSHSVAPIFVLLGLAWPNPYPRGACKGKKISIAEEDHFAIFQGNFLNNYLE
jgi:hypothetical protein